MCIWGEGGVIHRNRTNGGHLCVGGVIHRNRTKGEDKGGLPESTGIEHPLRARVSIVSRARSRSRR